MKLTEKEASSMRWLLFSTFLLLFLLTAMGTLGSLFFDLGPPLTEGERKLLVGAFLGEVGAGIGALFYSLFGIKRATSTTAETSTTARARSLTPTDGDQSTKFDIPGKWFLRFIAVPLLSAGLGFLLGGFVLTKSEPRPEIKTEKWFGYYGDWDENQNPYVAADVIDLDG